MNFLEFKRALRLLVDKSIKDKTDRQTFLRQMTAIANKYIGKDIFKQEILNAILAEYDFANKKSLTPEEKIPIDEVFTGLEPSFAKTKEGIIKKVALLVNDGIKENEFSKTLVMRLESIIGTYRNYAATIINTGLSGYDEISKHKDDPKNALYRYTGAPAQRAFCRSILGQTFTKEQIAKMNNNQGLSVWIYKGGFNCRHYWLLDGYKK